MTEEEKLDFILNDCIRRFNYDGVYLRTEMEAFWQDTCVKTTGQPDTNNEKFKAYLKELEEDKYVEFNTTQKFYKATIRGKRFGGYANQKKLDEKDREIKELTRKQLKFRIWNLIVGAIIGVMASLTTTYINKKVAGKGTPTRIQILDYPKIGDTMKISTTDSLVDIHLREDSIKHP